MADLREKTLFITGASRGIGKAIALRAAQDGANLVIAAKTTEPHPTLPGTIYSAAEEIEAAGGRALPIPCDIRFEDQVATAFARAAEAFGGIDILVNNASAISLTGTVDTPMRRFDLMHQVNARGTYACCQAAHPWLKQAGNPHILTLSPPLDMSPRWFAPHVGYTMAKYGMSMCMLGMADEFRDDGIACNALWPRTVIATAAVAMLPGVDVRHCRKPEIVADAAHIILCRSARDCSGNFFIDEEVLAQEGVKDFERYAVEPGENLLPDLFLD